MKPLQTKKQITTLLTAVRDPETTTIQKGQFPAIAATLTEALKYTNHRLEMEEAIYLIGETFKLDDDLSTVIDAADVWHKDFNEGSRPDKRVLAELDEKGYCVLLLAERQPDKFQYFLPMTYARDLIANTEAATDNPTKKPFTPEEEELLESLDEPYKEDPENMITDITKELVDAMLGEPIFVTLGGSPPDGERTDISLHFSGALKRDVKSLIPKEYYEDVYCLESKNSSIGFHLSTIVAYEPTTNTLVLR